MERPFTPTRQDVERYRKLRAVSMELNHRIIKTIPRETYMDVGAAIGILHKGVLQFETEDASSVLMDCCLYDWFENGKNVVQRYEETHPAKPGTDERFLLDAYLQAKYRIIMVQSAAPGAGVHCQDVLNGGELFFLMDVGLSQSTKGGNAMFASRTIPLGEYSMTAGAALPLNTKEALDALRRLKIGKRKSIEDQGSVALSIVRACLGAGAANYVIYESAEAKRGRHHHR